jgi:hypothetical protein
MTGEQSRLLKIGDRVSWAGSLIDLGTVKSNGWDGVVINANDKLTPDATEITLDLNELG